MKKIKYLFVMVFAVLLSVSCSGDDDSSSDPGINALVGTWETSAIEDGEEIKVRVTFNANNSGTSAVTWTIEGETETLTENFTWSTSGNKLTMISGGESDVVTYAIVGNKLTITEQDDEVVVFTKQ